jgi:large subunit ribosomal protein L29
MKPSDLREKSQDDLRELEKSLARDVFQNRLKNFTNRLDDTSAMRKTKRDLARVKTLLHESAKGLVRIAKAAAAPVVAETPADKPSKPAKKAAPKAEAKAAVPAAAESKPKKAAAKSKKSAKTESEAK